MSIDTVSQRLRRRRTKIVATLGPASSDIDTVEALIGAGVDVFRLNFSHGTRDEHARAVETVRMAAESTGERVAVLGDLCGPKIRVGTFEGGSIELVDGSEVVVTVREVVGSPGLIPSAYAGLADDVAEDGLILLDDGRLELRVLRIEGTEVHCRVEHGGLLGDRKGLNLPRVRISVPALTDKDREDAALALELGVDLLALSFVQDADDVRALRALIKSKGGAAGHRDPSAIGIIAKIEKPDALDNIDGILEAADGIMVARGDLGVELRPETVPIAQSQLVDLARANAKPVIVATQMLESMVADRRPTRAEVTDVSMAVGSGADAVMLSAETASGENPVGAVEMMDRIARATEGYAWRKGAFSSLSMRAPRLDPGEGMDVRDAVARASGLLSRDLMVRAIVVFSRSGWSARMVAAGRPQSPVIGISDDASACNRMNLLWGVVPVQAPLGDGTDPMHDLARQVAVDAGLAKTGDYILRVGGFHVEERHNAPTVSVLTV